MILHYVLVACVTVQ